MNDKKYNERLAYYDNSEVMANFAKIAYDSGLIESEENDDFKDAPKLEPADKDELKNKYNVDTGPDKDGRDLTERAHPDKINILDSYLTGGGVVENNQEAQDIDIQVATKGPTINDVHHKEIAVATSELIDQLVLIADEMDVRQEKELSIFADHIIAGINKSAQIVKKKLNKQAGATRLLTNPSVLKWLAAVAGVGLAAAFVGKEVESGDVVSVEDAIDSFINNLNIFKNTKSDVQSISIDINVLNSLVSKLEAAKSDYLLSRSMFIDKFDEFMSFTDTNGSNVDGKKMIDELKSLYNNLVNSLNKIQNTYTKGVLTREGIENILNRMNKFEKSENDFSSWDNLFNNTKHILETLYSKKQDAENALGLLDKSIETEKEMRKANLEYAIRLLNQMPSPKQNGEIEA